MFVLANEFDANERPLASVPRRARKDRASEHRTQRGTHKTRAKRRTPLTAHAMLSTARVTLLTTRVTMVTTRVTQYLLHISRTRTDGRQHLRSEARKFALLAREFGFHERFLLALRLHRLPRLHPRLVCGFGLSSQQVKSF